MTGFNAHHGYLGLPFNKRYKPILKRIMSLAHANKFFIQLI
jgi:hypothetical protein